MLTTTCIGLYILITTIPFVTCQCAVTGIIISNEPCDYEINGKMEFYTNANFTDVLDPIPVINKNTYMYLRVEMFNASYPGVNLLVESCWATSTADHVPLLYNFTVVEFPGCPIKQWGSITPVTNNGLSKVVTVSFPTFYLLPDSPEFYFHCSIGTCNGCLKDVCDSTESIPRTYSVSAAILTLGPIRREITTTVVSPTSEEPLISNQVLIILIIILSVLIFFLLVLVVACLCYPKCEDLYMRKTQEKGYNTPVLVGTITHFDVDNHSDCDSGVSSSGSSPQPKYEAEDGSVYSSVNKKTKQDTSVL